MRFNNTPYLFYFLLLGFIINCQNKEIYKPEQNSKTDYLKKTQEYAKQREESERKYLESWINKQKDSLGITFETTSSSIWIRFINKTNKPKTKIGNWVYYTAEIKTLDNEVIYSEAEFGDKKGVLGKFKDIRGIESALLLMGEGDKTELVIPSFSAYGLYGDEAKIGANVPLFVSLHLIDVKDISTQNK